jgi:hypothetical protein
MFARIVAVLAAMALAPVAAVAQEAQPAAPAVDPAVLQGKLEALEEQFAETKADVAGMKRLKLSGYIQAAYIWQEAVSYNKSATAATPTAPVGQNFTVVRGRFKAAYDADWSQYVLQIDVIPLQVGIKEAYVAVKLPYGLALDAGLQLFPFGYEVFTTSSSDLDTLARARVTRAFASGEYDLGLALRGQVSLVNFKVGLFNGNGVNSGQVGRDNDQLKDFIGRAWVDLGMLTVGASGWYGKTINYARSDDKEYPRTRAAVDAQLFLDLLPIGGSALKGEYMVGQTTIGTASGNLGAGGNLPGLTSSAAVPTGAGWYVTGLQNVGPWNQLVVRYERYTPDRTVDFVAAPTTVKVQEELQVVVHTYIGANMKVSAAWYHPMNGEKGPTAPSDPKSDSYLIQAQAKF